MRGLSLPILCVAGCAAAGGPAQIDDLKVDLGDPARVFPAFQERIARRDYAGAFDCLSPGAGNAVGGWEGFYLGLTAFDAGRQLIVSCEVHGLDREAGRIRVCNPEFGVGRDFGITRLKDIYLLDLTPRDVDALRDSALAWHRMQVRSADGWHFAYPPDWTYAPLWRTCICGDRDS